MHFLFKKKIIFAVAGICALALTLRAFALQTNAPFWVDEFSSASQAKLLLTQGIGVFNIEQRYFEYHNITAHILMALSFALLGAAEWSARLPMAIIGSTVPLALYLLCLRVSKNTIISLCAALLAATSYFMIAWSTQARGYPIQQVLTIILLTSYIALLQTARPSKRHAATLVGTALLGIITHVSFLIVIAVLSLHYTLTHKRTRNTQLVLGIGALISSALLVKSGLILAITQSVQTQAFGANNLWYYHSFLWREYGAVTVLSALGAILMWQKYPQSRIIHIFISVYLSFFLFVYKPYNTRYLLVIFPLLLMMMTVAIAHISTLFTSKKYVAVTTIIITLAIIAQGNLFTIKPKRFYSVNHSFREIALVDYDQVYEIIQKKSATKSTPPAVIDTWWDRTRWYLGTDYQPLFAFRWDQESGRINGLSKSTPYTISPAGEKVIYKSGGVVLVSNLRDLVGVMKKHPQGFIFIDDTSMSQEVIEYAKQNLHHELYLDHYTYDDNPASIWPANLYSWGFENNEER